MRAREARGGTAAVSLEAMDGRRMAAGTLLHLFLLLNMNCWLCYSDHEWSYSGPNGPGHWKQWFPNCGGKHQSPIDIRKTREKKYMLPLTLKNYDNKMENPRIVNNGHSLKLIVDDSEATMTGGCLEGEYKFHHLHYHWGSTNSQGSEHTVNDKRYAMELHLIHINSKYEVLSEAVNFPDGLAVLGIFYQVRSFNSSSLESIVKAAGEVEFSGNKEVPLIGTLSLEYLLPLEQNRFYCYRNGSLTTPACYQSVTWTILASPVHIGQQQMDVFRQLHFGNSSTSPKMADNNRPVQDVNKRKVYFYNTSAAVSVSSMCILLLIAFAALSR